MTKTSTNLPAGYVSCPECGGYGDIDASSFGDHGRHPCFACGTTGVMTEAQAAQREALEDDARQYPGNDDGWAWDYRDEDYEETQEILEEREQRYAAEFEERRELARERRRVALAYALASYAFPADPDEIPF